MGAVAAVGIGERGAPVAVYAPFAHAALHESCEFFVPAAKTFVILFQHPPIAVKAIGDEREQLKRVHRIRRVRTDGKGHGIAECARIVLRVGDHIHEIGKKDGQIEITYRFEHARRQIVEPAEPLVALGTVGEYAVQIVRLRQKSHFMQAGQALVGTGEFARRRHCGAHLLRRHAEDLHVSFRHDFGVTESVIGETGRVRFLFLPRGDIYVAAFSPCAGSRGSPDFHRL